MNDRRPTVEDVARSALAAVDSEVALILAEQFVSERYANIAARTPLRALHQLAEVLVPAVLTAGTVTVAAGSDRVIGDATAAAAWAADDLTGRMLQLQTAWYRIASVVGTELKLTTPTVDPAITAGGYRIVQREFALAPDARTLGDFINTPRRLRLRKMSRADLDYFAPARQHVSYGPTVVVDTGMDAAGRRLVEFYPSPPTPTLVRYDYWQTPPRLELTDAIPGSVDLHMLKEGVLIDLYRHLAARALKTGDANAAGFWRNEARAQETRWEQYVNQALLNDRGLDDVETRLRSSWGAPYGLDPMTAYDEIWSRGLRP